MVVYIAEMGLILYSKFLLDKSVLFEIVKCEISIRKNTTKIPHFPTKFSFYHPHYPEGEELINV